MLCGLMILVERCKALVYFTVVYNMYVSKLNETKV